MSVKLQSITLGDKPILENLFQLYLYEMSKSVGFDISEAGTFDYDPDIVEAYFNKSQHHPYFIISNGKLAGFALVRNYPDTTDLLDMGQFFVLGSFMRQGVGRAAFDLCLKAHTGRWQVRVLPDNVAAQKFWKRTVSELTDDTYTMDSLDYQGKEMIFLSFAS
ncbi:hypothetical protein GCM10007094_27890 [Pseudovibrio japonicus]|uniref:N-acetyltransferase domain-containing protein n=2 Tax=Pseudovibrio japonicus TaxID=366534 RepID=A0ABQ3EFD3_9HYPH|nr:hypothetical protein GCM10007094_27890 [Pseudovibrio japonicus]